MMAELTGMDIANASMYEGTTATAEAMMVAFDSLELNAMKMCVGL